MNNCEVQIEDSLLSKYQAHITYNESNGWILVDGLNGKSSTNGTWLYIKDEIEMFSGMIIKANQTLFNVSIDN
jgi:FHA domain